MHLPTRLGACLTQTGQERLAILMVAEDLPALVAAVLFPSIPTFWLA
jgi:hypothetical protein